jgi:hypothetical protein
MTKRKSAFVDVGPPTTVNKPAAPPETVVIDKGAAEVPYVPPAPQPAAPAAGVWQQMTTEADNQTKDVGLVSVAWIGVMVLGAIPLLIILTAWQVWIDPAHKFDPQPLGVAIGAICTGFGVALGALGAYRNLQAKATS